MPCENLGTKEDKSPDPALRYSLTVHNRGGQTSAGEGRMVKSRHFMGNRVSMMLCNCPIENKWEQRCSNKTLFVK